VRGLTATVNNRSDVELGAKVDETVNMNDNVGSNKSIEEIMAFLAVDTVEADNSIETCFDISNMSDISDEMQVQKDSNNVMSVVRGLTATVNNRSDVELGAKVDETVNINDNIGSDENIKEIMAFLAVDAIHADDSIEMSRDGSNVSDISEEIQVDEKVDEILGSVRGLTATEDIRANANFSAEVNKTVYINDSMGSDKNIEEIMALLAVNAVDADNSIETCFNDGNMSDISDEIQVEKDGNEVVSVLGTITTLLDISAKTEKNTEIEDVLDMDDKVQVKENLQDVVAVNTINTALVNGILELLPDLINFGVGGEELLVVKDFDDVLSIMRRRDTTFDIDSKAQPGTEISDAIDVNNDFCIDQSLEQIVATLTIDTTNKDSSVDTRSDVNEVSNIGNQVEVDEDINDVLTAGGSVSRSRSGSRTRRVTSGSRGSRNSRRASMREATTLAVADGVGCGADTLRGVIPVVRNEPILATEVARLRDVANRLAMVGVGALLAARLAMDQVGEEVMGLIFTTKQVGNVLSNRVGRAEIGEDGQAQAKVKVTRDQRLAAGENVKKVHVEIKSDADVEQSAPKGGLAEGMAGRSEGDRGQNEWGERRDLHVDKERVEASD
jgi:hypothetical protein